MGINYYAYIASEEWRQRAHAAKQRAGNRCQVCNRPSGEVMLNAHHRTYERLGNEHPDDITVLCRDCHELYERNRKIARPPINKPFPPVNKTLSSINLQNNDIYSLVNPDVRSSDKILNSFSSWSPRPKRIGKILIKRVGQILTVIFFVVIFLAQCASEDWSVRNPQSGQYESALTAVVSDVREYFYINRSKPQNAGAYVSMGFDDLAQGEFNRAIEEFTEAIKLAPENGEAYAGRGLAYDRLGKSNEAVENLSRAIELKVERADVYATLASNHFASGGDLEQIVRDLTKAIYLKSDYAWAYGWRGVAYIELDKFEEALQDFTKAIEYDQSNPENYKERGYVNRMLGNYRQALVDYSEAIKLRPDYLAAYQERGFARFPLGEFQVAIEDFDKAIELGADGFLDSVDLYFSYHGRGVAYAQMGNFAEAVKDYSEAITLQPEFAHSYGGRGYAYSQLGNPEQAIDDLEKYIKLASPDSPDFDKFNLMLGELKSQQNK